MGLFDIGSALASLDNFKRRVGLLMNDPSTVSAQNTQALNSNLMNMIQGSTNAAHDMSSVVPQVAQQGQQDLTQLMMGLGPLMTVYHGSPHAFDRFDSSKIGTGEGAQAYGHGLYFAENPDVGKKYATRTGNLYKADLPDETAAQMLHWDKPMSEQPAVVRELLHTPGQNDAETGAQIYHDLSLALGGRDVAAQKLRDIGIPGIRYPDQGSRATGQGTSNFVLFPGMEERVKIIGKE